MVEGASLASCGSLAVRLGVVMYDTLLPEANVHFHVEPAMRVTRVASLT